MGFHKIQTLYQKLNFATFLRLTIFQSIKKLIFPDANIHFAQEGEDVHILSLLENRSGFYLDIGCNHPIHYNNTFKLYLQGWTGILVDGNPRVVEAAKKIRKKDICLHALVSNNPGEMDFYVSPIDLISSVHPEHADSGSADQEKSKKLRLKTASLDQIILEHVPAGTEIDVLSIDVEGHDFEVLQSITLTRNRPRLIIIEDLLQDRLNMAGNKYVIYLQQQNYILMSSDKLNLYFMRMEDFRK